MNNKQRRALNKIEAQEVKETIKKYPDQLTEMPVEDWSRIPHQSNLVQVWNSKKYLVQVYREHSGIIRLSINRVSRNQGNWADKLTWDELQEIKRAVGFGEAYAVEVYPQDSHVVNVANFRHLWILPRPLNIGWRNDPADEGGA